MTFAQRTLITLAVMSMALAAEAQQGRGNAQTFANLSPGELQANRTAALLAASQQRPQLRGYSSNPAMNQLDDRFMLAVAPPAPVAMPAYSRAPVSAAAPSYGRTPVFAAAASGTSLSSSGSIIPAMPDARPGECFALVRTPERFQTYQRDYELRAASERIETIAPRYENVTEQYVLQEAYERMEIIPASFRTVTEQLEVAAPSSHYEASEPIYQTITEQVLEQPARTVWKQGNGLIQRVDNTTGDIMCLVEEPAIYKTVTRRVLKAPAEARQVSLPGQYQLVNRRVLDRPAEVRRVVVPQQLATRTVRKQVEPGALRRVSIPAQVGSTTVRELVEPARLEWRSVLCETNMTPQNIQQVQAALAREGFNPGTLDGRLNGATLNALNAYQRARNLPEDRYLNMDTVRALGVM